MISGEDQEGKTHFRKSMNKFTGRISTCLYVCDDGYSRPRLGFLIKQFIMLLSGLNIPDEIFLKKQEEHFHEIASMTKDMNIAMKYLLYFDRIDLIYHLLSNNIESIELELKILQKKSFRRM